MMRRIAGPLAAALMVALGGVPASVPADAATRLFITNHVNSNQILGLTPWQGGLAAATQGGLVFVDTSTEELTKLMRTPGGLPSNNILCVAQSPSGALWAGTADEGIARMKADGTFRRPLTSFDGLPSDRVQSLYVTGDSVWVGTNGGVALLTENPATGQVLLRRSDTSASTGGALVANDVAAFRQMGDTVWCGTSGGVSTFAGGAWQNRASALGAGVRAFALHEDTLWAATAAGPRRYASGTFTLAAAGHVGGSACLRSIGGTLYSGSELSGPYQYAAGAWIGLGLAGLPSSRVNAIEIASGGAFWFGTPGGLASGQPVPGWHPVLSQGPAVNGSQRAVADSRGVWIATGNFAPATGLGAVLHYDGTTWTVLTSLTTGNSLQAASVFSVLSDRSADYLWFGHCCGEPDPKPRVDRWNPASDVWDRPATTNIYALAQSADGRVFAGSVEHGNGVYEFDEASAALLDSLTPLNTQGGVGLGLTSNNLRGIAFDSKGRGWFSTANTGLDIWDEGGTIANHADDVWIHLGTTGFPSVQTSAVVTDGPSSGWVGTVAGVVRIRNDVVDPSTTGAVNAALPSVQVKDLARDPSGNLWIATAGGLARVDAASGAVEKFTTADGLAGDDVLALAWDAARGALWAGTTGGVSEIYPSSNGGATFGSGTYLYPNPITPASTELRLGGISGEVKGEVRDLNGSVIRTFQCNPAQNAVWDLRTGDGSPAAPGIYLVMLRAEGRTQTLRAAVVR
jgi:ligand-binding sensor domain-containing protein